jgi:hypothetical protein
MTPFTIEANPPFLSRDIRAYYHANFHGASHPENPNFLYKLKNDIHHNWTNQQMTVAMTEFARILLRDLPIIKQNLQLQTLTVCVVPRAKAEETYNPNQLYFRDVIGAVINQNLVGFENGTRYITRHTNTKTTHLRNPVEGFVNDGQLPYAGITLDTCTISPNVIGKNILLIDDIYTKTVNIDEDAIQALLTRGASSVAFYSVGKTVSKF